MEATDRNRMYNTIATIAAEYPEANLDIVAVGLGASSAVIQDGVLAVTLKDGSVFTFVTVG